MTDHVGDPRRISESSDPSSHISLSLDRNKQVPDQVRDQSHQFQIGSTWKLKSIKTYDLSNTSISNFK